MKREFKIGTIGFFWHNPEPATTTHSKIIYIREDGYFGASDGMFYKYFSTESPLVKN